MPAPDNDNASGKLENVDELIVVLPTAYKLRLPRLEAEITSYVVVDVPFVSEALLVEKPTLTIPPPETWLKELPVRNGCDDMEEVCAVVLPTAYPPTVVGPDTMILESEIPMETRPAPSNESDPIPATPDDVLSVVLPTANKD